MSTHLHSDCADWAERPCSGDPCRHGQTACPVASACQKPEEGKAPRKCRLGGIGPVHRMLLRKAPTYTFEFIVALALICLIARAFR